MACEGHTFIAQCLVHGSLKDQQQTPPMGELIVVSSSQARGATQLLGHCDTQDQIECSQTCTAQLDFANNAPNCKDTYT